MIQIFDQNQVPFVSVRLFPASLVRKSFAIAFRKLISS